MKLQPGSVVWIDHPYENLQFDSVERGLSSDAVTVLGKSYPAIVIAPHYIVDRRSLRCIDTRTRQKRNGDLETIRVYRAERRVGWLVCFAQSLEPFFSSEFSRSVRGNRGNTVRRYLEVKQLLPNRHSSFVDLMPSVVCAEAIGRPCSSTPQQVIDQIVKEMIVLALFVDGAPRKWKLSD